MFTTILLVALAIAFSPIIALVFFVSVIIGMAKRA